MHDTNGIMAGIFVDSNASKTLWNTRKIKIEKFAKKNKIINQDEVVMLQLAEYCQKTVFYFIKQRII